jgi:hypothetical protein
MKLRISGNSIRLRLLRSELSTFMETGRIEETVHLGLADDALLRYGLEHESGLATVEVRHRQAEITINVPTQLAASWASSEQIGIYSVVDLGRHGSLDIIVEKDFACLDLSDAENQDTFPNPQIGVAC